MRACWSALLLVSKWGSKRVQRKEIERVGQMERKLVRSMAGRKEVPRARLMVRRTEEMKGSKWVEQMECLLGSC
jgi:hypothetical protein